MHSVSTLLRTLLVKDIRQHRLVAFTSLLAAILVPWGVVLIDRLDGMQRTIDQRAALDFSIALVIAYFAPSMIAFWLMASERTKRTLLVLRMLPISSDLVIGSKELSGLVMLAAIASLNLLSFFFAFRVLFGSYPALPGLWSLLFGLLCLSMLLQASLWLLLSFEQKWATQAPFLFACLIRPLLLAAHGIQPYFSEGLLHAIRLGTVPLLFGVIFFFHYKMRKEFDDQDWAMPTSE